MIHEVRILGGGSAGFLAAVTLKAKLPELDVRLLRSPQIGIIGVGEGTTVGVPRHLHSYLKVPFRAVFELAQPTWKLGIRFHWGPRSHFNYTFGRQVDGRWPQLARPNGFYCADDFAEFDLPSALMDVGKAFVRDEHGFARIANFAAYHFENPKFVHFLEKLASRLGVVVQDGNVTDVEIGEVGVCKLHLDSGESVSADLFVDASGFGSLMLGKALREPFIEYRSTLFCDRAVVGGWEREEEPVLPYTTADTMQSGWAWQIEHERLINRGYVFSSAFASDDQAAAEFLDQNPKIKSPRFVSFPSGRYRRMWVKNVVAIGNAAGFVEPLEATSLAAICDEARFLAESLYDCQMRPTPTICGAYNMAMGQLWDNIRDFLAVHYKFNTRFDSPFWQACREDVDLAGASAIVEYYRQNGPSLFGRQILMNAFDQFGLEGYYTLLLGQDVRHDAAYTPTADETKFWQNLRKQYRMLASTGLSVSETLTQVRLPSFGGKTQPPIPLESGIPTR